MSQALTTGVSTGTSLALLWKVLEGVQLQPPPFCLPSALAIRASFPFAVRWTAAWHWAGASARADL